MSAALCMPAIDDREDDPPHYHLRAMPDQDDAEHTETMAPPTDREAPTQTKLEKPEPRIAINPAPMALATQGDSYFAEAARDFAASLVEMRATRAEIAGGFESQDKKLDHISHEFSSNFGLLSGEFKTFRAVIEARLDDGQRRFDAIEKQLERLEQRVTDAEDAAERSRKHAAANKEQVEVLRKELEKIRAAGTAPTPPAQQA